MIVSSKIPKSANGKCLSDYLATRFTYLSEKDWCHLIDEGRISLNGVISTRTKTLAKGDILSCDMPDFTAPSVNFDYTIVYQDEWLLAINKPPGLRVHSGGKFVHANLVYHLRYLHEPAFPDAYLVNRLDADTSGLVLFARNKEVLTQLMQQFADGTVKKSYLALAAGAPSPAEGRICLPIGPVEGSSIPRHAVDMTHGKEAVTFYRTLRPLDNDVTLLELQPETGRTHQLRVHLAAIGHPLIGDALYTMSDEEYLAWVQNPRQQTGLKRQALHSHSLELLHPINQERLTLTAPLTPDLADYINTLDTTASSE